MRALTVLGVFTFAVVAAALVGGQNTRVFTDGLERSVRESDNRLTAVRGATRPDRQRSPPCTRPVRSTDGTDGARTSG